MMVNFSLKSVFIAIVVAAILSMFWVQSQRINRQNDIINFRPDFGTVTIRQYNDREGILLIGEGCHALVSLTSRTGKRIASEELGQGTNLIRLYLGGPDNEFGFFLNGEKKTVKCSFGMAGQSFSGTFTIGAQKELASVIDDEELDGFKILLVVTASK